MDASRTQLVNINLKTSFKAEVSQGPKIDPSNTFHKITLFINCVYS